MERVSGGFWHLKLWGEVVVFFSSSRWGRRSLAEMIQRRCTLAAAIVLLPLALCGQISEAYERAWVARYDGPAAGFDQVRGIALAPNGDIIAVGQTRGFGDVFEMLAWRLTAAGQPSQSWPDNGAGVGIRRFRSLVGNSSAAAVVVRPDGDTFIAGYGTRLDRFEDFMTVRLDPSGDLSPLWPATSTQGQGVRYYDRLGGADEIRAATLSTEGHIMVAGRSAGVTVPPVAVFIRYGQAGGQDGGQIYPTGSSGPAAEAVGIIPWDGNGAVIGGRVQRPGGHFAYFIARFNANGSYSTAWPNLGSGAGLRFYTGAGSGLNETHSELTALARMADGGVVVTGLSANTDGRYDVATVAWSATGGRLWEVRRRAFAGGNDRGVALAVAPGGDILVLSESEGEGTGRDFELLRLTTAGAPSAAWPDTGHGVGVRRWNGAANGDDRPRALCLDRFGNVYVTGESARSGGGSSLVVIKFTADGRLAWEDAYEGPGGATDQPAAILIGAADTVVVGGTSAGDMTGQDALVAAYTQRLPTWEVEPAPVLGQGGEILRLSANAIGQPGLVTTWRRNGQVVGSGQVLLPGPLTEQTAGDYEVSVSDGFNTLTATFPVAGMALVLESGQVHLRVLGPNDRALAIDSSQDLQLWTPWQAFSLTSGAVEYAVPLPQTRVFYRLRLP